MVLAIGAAGFLVSWPCSVQGVEASAKVRAGPAEERGEAVATEERRFCTSLLEASGPEVLPWLALPVVLTAGVWAGVERFVPLAWLLALGLVAFSLLTGFSIGLFYLPAAGAATVAAALASGRGR